MIKKTESPASFLAAQTRGTTQPRTLPTVVVQPKMNGAPQSARRPVAPPAYRPNPAPKVLQMKPRAGQPHACGCNSKGKTTPHGKCGCAPHGHAPAGAAMQPKAAGNQPLRPGGPVAPPAYRPLPAPRVVQPRMATGAAQASTLRGQSPPAQRAGINGPTPAANRTRVVQRTTGVVQLFACTDGRDSSAHQDDVNEHCKGGGARSCKNIAATEANRATLEERRDRNRACYEARRDIYTQCYQDVNNHAQARDDALRALN